MHPNALCQRFLSLKEVVLKTLPENLQSAEF